MAIKIYTADQQKYRDYILANKDKLDKTKTAQLSKDIGAFKEFKTTGSISSNYFVPKNPVGGLVKQPDIKALGDKIKTGNFTAKDTLAYNQSTGNNQGARELALGSQQAVNNMATSVTPEEFTSMKNSGIKDSSNMGKGITADLQGGTKEEFKQKVNEIKRTTPTTTTDITYNEDKNPYDPNKVINKAPQYTGADGKSYQTVRNSDNTLTTIDVSTGQAVTGKYTDTERESIKQGFITGDKNQQEEINKQEEINNQKELGNINNNPDAIFGMMMTGQPITEDIKKLPNYTKQKTRYDNYIKYSNLSDNLLTKTLAKGDLLPGTEAYNDLIKDPIQAERIKKSQQLNTIQGNKIKEEEVFENKSEEIMKDNPTVENALRDGSLSQDEINQITNTPDIMNWSEKVNNSKKKVDTLQQAYDDVETQVEAELKGTGATTSMRASLIANRRKSMVGDLNLAINNYNTDVGTLTQMKSEATSLLNMNLGFYKERKAQEAEILREQEQRAYNEKREQNIRAYNEQLATKQLEQKYSYEYGDLSSTNPNIQNVAIERAVEGMYKNYPIPGMESQATKVQKVKDRIAKGMTGTQAIKSVEDEIRNSQRYKDYLASERDKLTTNGKVTYGKVGTNENGDDIYGFVDTGTKTVTGTTGADLYKSMTASTNPIGVYATGDMDGSRHRAIYNTAQTVGLEAFIKKYKGTKITSEMVNASAEKYGVDPLMIARTMALDSSMGTAGKGARNNNPGNVGQFDSLDAKGITVKGYTTLQEGINAVANNLAKRQNALGITTGGQAGDDDITNKIMNSWDGKDIKALAKNLGVGVNTAKNQYDTWKQGNKLNSQDTIILGSFLKDISGTAVNKEERAIYEQQYLDMKKKGLSTQEIKNQLSLYVPTAENSNNQSVKNQLSQLQKYSSKLGVKASETMATLINQGDYKGAIQELENASYAQKKVDTKSISDAGSLIKKGNDLKAKITKYEESFGPIQQWETKAVIKFSDDPGVQGLLGDMANFVAKYRNAIAGSAITTGEAGFLEPLIADIKDNPKNAIAKVNSIQRSLVNEINTVRDQVGLPQLNDWRSFYDINLRSQAYKGNGTTPAKVQVPSTVKTQIIKTSNGKSYNINF